MVQDCCVLARQLLSKIEMGTESLFKIEKGVKCMFAGKTFWDILSMGGVTLGILGLFSVVSLAIILERVFYFRRNKRIKRTELMKALSASLEQKDYAQAADICRKADTPFARVALEGLNKHGKGELALTNAMDRQKGSEINNLERYTGLLGSVGSTVVYVGLFGTVLGIIRAFQDIALTANGTGGGVGMVINGIAEALISTALGICVAVPAVIAFNLLQKAINNFALDMDLCASEMTDLLRDK